MKRDMDLIRVLLLEIESNDTIPKWHDLPEDDVRRRIFHLLLLREAGLVAGFEVQQLQHGEVAAIRPLADDRTRLTWAGHDFLDAARSDTVWNATKKKLGVVTDAVSFALLTEILAKTTKELMGMSP